MAAQPFGALGSTLDRRLVVPAVCQARITVANADGWIEYHSRRRAGPNAVFRGRYRPTGEVRLAQPGSLEYWLTERYCLYATDGQGAIYRGDITHPPWPLQPAEAVVWENSLLSAQGIALPDTRSLLQFARRLDVLVWPLAPAYACHSLG